MLAFCLGMAAATLAQDKNDAKAAHALYEKALKKKQAHERIADLREAAARFPRAAELQYGLGREFYQAGQLDSAVVRFERAASQDNELAQKTNLPQVLAAAYASLTTQRFGRGRLLPALDAALAGLHYDPRCVSCLTTAAVVYQQLGDYEQAISMGLRVVALQPQAQNYNNLGAAYENKGDWLAAQKYYREALALSPQLVEAQNNLQRVNSRLTQPQPATPSKLTSTAPPAKKEPDLRSKTPPRDSKLSPNRPATKKSTSVPPAPPAAQKKLPTISPAVAAEPESQDSKNLARSSLPPLPAKTLKSTPPLDSTPAALPKELDTPLAPETAQKNGSALWWGLGVSLLLGATLWWKLFPHKAMALRFALERMFLRMRLARRRPAAAPAQIVKAKAGHTVKQAAQPVLAGDHEGLNDSLRMLHRVSVPATAGEFFEVSPSPGPGETPPAPPESDLVFSLNKLEDPSVAQDTPSPVPETEAPVAPESSAPPLGLQTEMLFAEMIAGAMASFEESEENGRAVDHGKNAAEPEIFSHEPTAPHQSAGNGVAQDPNAALAGAPARVNGKAEIQAPPPAPPDAPPVAAEPGQNAQDQCEHPPALPVEKSAEMTTMGFVAGVEEMMQMPAVPANSPPPGDSGLQLATRTVEIAALAQQRIGRYLIEREIAKATTGRIYKAWDPKLDRIVVLKTVQYGVATSPQEIAVLKDRIYREARAIAKLNHPNIIIVYDVDDEPEFSYLVMEYLEGRDLKQVLDSEHRLECPRALHIVTQVCEAMDYAHRAGVFHRDVKPSNIMLLDNDETKVMDFGIAKISNYLSLTQTGRVLGTPSYMAPEQIEGQATDGRADLFSLGAVLYELIAGKRPFAADSLAALAYKIVHKPHIPPSLENVEIPLEVDEVLQRALAKNPEERFQNALEFREALATLQAKLT